MSYNQIQQEATLSATAPCQYVYWWRKRQLRSERQRGRSPVRSASIQFLPAPAAVFDPERFRLLESSERIVDIEKGLQHSHSECSLRSNTTCTCASATCTLQGRRPRVEQQGSALKRHCRFVRHLRYSLFAVYQRLFTLICLLNLTVVLILLHYESWKITTAFKLDNLATLASSNFLLAILFRQDWLVNILFRSAWLAPWSLPLRARRVVSRVYCYGGIHSGAAVAGTIWWIVFTTAISWKCVTQGDYTSLILILTLVISSLLVTITIFSHPRLRVRYHDTWEMTHRFMGWLSIALFWAQMLLLTRYNTTQFPSYQGFAQLLVKTPTFWNLLVITLLLIYPWLLLRRWVFTAVPLSNHALQLSFPHRVHKFSCLALSSSPLREWHPFATFPSVSASGDGQGTEENSMVISAAGDWTRHLIATAQHKSKQQRLLDSSDEKTNGTKEKQTRGVKIQLYVKSHPRAGVLSLSCLYKSVLIVTTGSGIGPCLSSLLDKPAGQEARLVWSTRSPRKTYGEGIMQLVHRADPHALVLDTDELGRPDLLQVACRMYAEMRAEAVFVLSNEKVTKMVVGGLEKKGIPAFGPIWDS